MISVTCKTIRSVYVEVAVSAAATPQLVMAFIIE